MGQTYQICPDQFTNLGGALCQHIGKSSKKVRMACLMKSSFIKVLPAPVESQSCWYSPRKFLAKTDRRGIQYADPFPGLEHRYVEANGIRQAHCIMHAFSIRTCSKTAPTEWPICILHDCSGSAKQCFDQSIDLHPP